MYMYVGRIPTEGGEKSSDDSKLNYTVPSAALHRCAGRVHDAAAFELASLMARGADGEVHESMTAWSAA